MQKHARYGLIHCPANCSKWQNSKAGVTLAIHLTLCVLVVQPTACICGEVLPSPPFPLLFLTRQWSTLLDKSKEEISSSVQGERAAEPRNEKPERGSPQGLEKFCHCPGISNLEAEKLAPEKVKRAFLLVLSTKQPTLAETFLCQYNCVHTGLLPALQGSCGQEHQHSRASKHSQGKLATDSNYLHCITAGRDRAPPLSIPFCFWGSNAHVSSHETIQ